MTLKLLAGAGCALALVLGIGANAYAKTSNYSPPASMSCVVSASGATVTCADLNHTYLTETVIGPTTADGTYTYNFASAISVPAAMNVPRVEYFYSDSDSKMILLSAVNPSIGPDFSSEHWVKGYYGLYNCNTSAAECPITNLPS